MSSILERIRLGKVRLAVLGLGHVGLPTALAFARAGFKVKAIDVDVSKVRALNKGICYIREPGLQEILVASLKNGTFEATSDMSDPIRTSDFVSICVPTPVENGVPDLKYLEAAFAAVKAGAHSGMVILLESTLPPSTTSKLVAPGLEHLGYKVDEDIFLAYCPERLSPVQALRELHSNARIVGGIGPKSSQVAAAFFRKICKDVLVTDALTAEITKVAENTFRDLNIAYANLLALITESLGGDVSEVISLANTHPRVRIHKPGLGVGGPCLPKDPYMLINAVPEAPSQLLSVARKLNRDMSKHAVALLLRSMQGSGAMIADAKVAVLGVAYKADTEDVTNSPAEYVVRELLSRGATVSVYDPYASETYGAERATSIEQALRGANCVILMTPHTSFKSIRPTLIKRLARPGCLLFDGPRMLDVAEFQRHGIIYLGTGYGKTALLNESIDE
jgi:UDP-N-acetyl-D-mannosaminuronic acid dehydrogenase